MEVCEWHAYTGERWQVMQAALSWPAMITHTFMHIPASTRAKCTPIMLMLEGATLGGRGSQTELWKGPEGAKYCG